MLCSSSLVNVCLVPVSLVSTIGDRDGFLHRGDAHLRVHRGAEADRDLDALVDDGLETGELELHGVRADFETRKLVGTGFARDCRQRLEQGGSRERHRDARKDCP